MGEKKFDPTGYSLPILYIYGDISAIAESKDNKVKNLLYRFGEREGTCTLKGQGATSYTTAAALIKQGRAGKFNYTITFDEPFEAKKGTMFEPNPEKNKEEWWGPQKKYCLKANWIDPTHSRNVVSCKLWGTLVENRDTVPSWSVGLPNGGAIDGFPIIMMLNDEFHGLYTMNIPKDGWMFGLVEDPTKTQAIVSSKDHTPATRFREASMSGYEIEFASNEDDVDWVTTSLTRLIDAIVKTDGSDLDTTISQYLDWDSAIDYYIHAVIEKATDCIDKNFILVTFDGVKWYFSNYDRDSIWGLNWDGSGTSRPVSNVTFIETSTGEKSQRVFELIRRFKTNTLKARYNKLREDKLSESRIMETFENFAWSIPSTVMAEDVKLYPTIQGSSVNTIDQIGRFVRQRLVKCDEWIKNLPAQETPPSGGTTYSIITTLSGCTSSNTMTSISAKQPYQSTITANNGYTLTGATVSVKMGGVDITSTAYSNGKINIASVTDNIVITITAAVKTEEYTNWAKKSFNVDGTTIFNNGKGYQTGIRLSSGGGTSTSNLAADSSKQIITGFIPFKAGSTIRLKGVEFVGAAEKYNTHFYLNFYETLGNTACQSLTEDTFSSGNGSCTTYEYDETTGIATLGTISGVNTVYGQGIDKGEWVRICVYGNPDNFILTVDEEIPTN